MGKYPGAVVTKSSLILQKIILFFKSISFLFCFSQGGSEILESLGYTEYTGFALQYPRSVVPQFFADHIGNLTVELVLASVEISTLLIRVPPTLETLSVLMEAEAFPGNEPEGM